MRRTSRSANKSLPLWLSSIVRKWASWVDDTQRGGKVTDWSKNRFSCLHWVRRSRLISSVLWHITSSTKRDVFSDSTGRMLSAACITINDSNAAETLTLVTKMCQRKPDNHWEDKKPWWWKKKTSCGALLISRGGNEIKFLSEYSSNKLVCFYSDSLISVVVVKRWQKETRHSLMICGLALLNHINKCWSPMWARGARQILINPWIHL